MIRITDRTLSCIDKFDPDIKSVKRFLELLIETEVDGIEISEKYYKLLSPLPDFKNYILRLKQPESAAEYPHIVNFVVHNLSYEENEKTFSNMLCEIQISGIRESYTLSKYSKCRRIRLQGLETLMSEDYDGIFKRLKEIFGEFEFCPSNRCYTATALAAEFIAGKYGANIVTSFSGLGGFAPTEEVIMILRSERIRKPSKNYLFFPEMSELISEIIGEKISGYKPIIGENIFWVESGIHVDGIIKQPKCYEPFPPETVGLKRKIIIGKQSGTASVKAKLAEFDVRMKEKFIPLILEQVKFKSAEKNSSLTDTEFAEIVKECCLNEKTPQHI
jgi:homocitrate synthase NifV